jgi:serpin B
MRQLVRFAIAVGISIAASATGAEPKDDAISRGFTGRPVSVAEQAILKALESKVEWNDDSTPLQAALEAIAKRHDFRLYIDTVRLEEAGQSDLGTTRSKLSGLPLRSALSLVLGEKELDWTIYKDTLYISTAPRCWSDLQETRVYDLADLLVSKNSYGEPEEVPIDQLMETISTTIRAPTWDAAGGSGTLRQQRRGELDVLVVSHSWRVHDEIAALLSGLRRTRALTDVLPEVKKSGDSSKADRSKSLRKRQREGEAEVMKGSSASKVAPDSPEGRLSNSHNQFACDVYSKLRTTGDQNLFLSPYCIYEALAMTAAGARGETAAELAGVLHSLADAKELHQALAAIRAGVVRTHPQDGRLLVANRLWGQKDYAFAPEYLKLTDELYGASLMPVDFRSPSATAAIINRWVDVQTGGKIKQLYKPSDLDPVTRLILTSAIYFQGKWKFPFEKTGTRTEHFDTGSGRIQVPMMSQEDTFAFFENDLGQFLTLPYAGDALAMTILLPRRLAGALAKLEAAVQAKQLDEWIAAQKQRLVLVHVPRFTFESQFGLNEVLSSLGAARAFDSDRADFSGISTEKPFFIQDFVHKAVIQVDEEGTVAAAVTGGAFGGGSAVQPRPIIFRADRPFLFLIRDHRTGTNLFMGRVVRPSESVDGAAKRHAKPAE